MFKLSRQLWFRPKFRLLVALIAVAPLLAGLLAVGVSHAQASGHNEIRVLQDQWEIRFPDEIVFSLSAESRSDIERVRLNYRIANQSPLAYSYADFQTGQQINASFHLPTSGAGYLPPGTLLEYGYVIDDTDGNRLETAFQAIEYTDTRYQWTSTQAGPLTLMHHDIAQSRVDPVARELEQELGRVQGLLEIDSAQPIRGYIYNDFDEAVAAFPYQSATITAGEVFHGFAYSSSQVFLGIGLDQDLLVHEATHLLLNQALGPSGTAAPSWLDEGFASYMEPDSRPYSGSSLTANSLPLRSMSGVSGNPQDIHLFYAKAESVVSYLIEEHGEDSFRQFINALSRNVPVENALRFTYGFGVDELDSKWSRSNEGLSAPSSGRVRTGPPSPLLYLDTWLFGGLILLAVATVTVRYVWGRLRPAADAEEGWNDELDEVWDEELWDDEEKP